MRARSSRKTLLDRQTNFALPQSGTSFEPADFGGVRNSPNAVVRKVLLLGAKTAEPADANPAPILRSETGPARFFGPMAST